MNKNYSNPTQVLCIAAVLFFSSGGRACIGSPKYIVLKGASFSDSMRVIPSPTNGANLTLKNEDLSEPVTFSLNEKSELCMQEEGKVAVCKAKGRDQFSWVKKGSNPEVTTGEVVVDYDNKSVFLFSVDKSGKKSVSLPYHSFTFVPPVMQSKDGPATFADMAVESFKDQKRVGRMLVEGAPRMRSMNKGKTVEMEMDGFEYKPSSEPKCGGGFNRTEFNEGSKKDGAAAPEPAQG